MPELRRGFLFGLSAYLLWGLFPLYWKLIDSSGALELLAHRICGHSSRSARWCWYGDAWAGCGPSSRTPGAGGHS